MEFCFKRKVSSTEGKNPYKDFSLKLTVIPIGILKKIPTGIFSEKNQSLQYLYALGVSRKKKTLSFTTPHNLKVSANVISFLFFI